MFYILVTEVQFPCIRAIVIKSSKLKVGSLFIVTYIGGTIGRYNYGLVTSIIYIFVLFSVLISVNYLELISFLLGYKFECRTSL